jgi:voltage-gated sodium channel
LISAFAVLNLFLALIVDSLQAIKDQEKQEILAATQKITQSQTDEVIREIEELEQKILDLKQKLKS